MSCNTISSTKDGRVLKSKKISSHQSGEKIQINILKDIIFEAKQAYKNTYNKKLEHIVFHRDGINREDIDLLKEITNSLEIKFDYVESHFYSIFPTVYLKI